MAFVPGTLTIVSASSTTSLATNTTSIQYGDNVTLTATVAPSSATGTVVFEEGQNTLGTATLSSGTAALSLTALPAGQHTITASYLGDSNIAGSTSTPIQITVSKKTGPNGAPYLIATVDNTTRLYGHPNPVFSYTLSGPLLNGDTPATAVTGEAIYTTPATIESPPTTYPVSISGGLNSINYLLGFANGTLTETSNSITVTLASSVNPSPPATQRSGLQRESNTTVSVLLEFE